MTDGRPGAGTLALAVISTYPRQSVATFMAVAAAMIIIVNALWLQPGRHPAPIFAPRPVAVPAVAPPPAVAPAPAPAPAAAVVPAPAPAPAARSRGEIITDLQRELARKGFYDGAVDGIWGAKTDTALRDFAQAVGARFAPEASEEVLRLVTSSTVTAGVPGSRREAPRHDPIATLLAPRQEAAPPAPPAPPAPVPPREIPAAQPAPGAKRLVAVQRALSEFGYGQIRPTGTMGPETQAAIERFERDRKLPVTGQLSERLLRELALVTGRPID